MTDNFEPKEYFEYLKSRVSTVTLDSLIEQNKTVDREITKADSVGAKNVTHKLSVLREIIIKEKLLVEMGLTKYVDRADVLKFIDNVKPANSVRIVEIQKYPRIIPEDNALQIKQFLDVGVFDEIVIVYTDFTDEDPHDKESRETVARNRDPIAFGIFRNPDINFVHDRLYFITDWEDEFCDLTFARMIEKMSKMGIKDPDKDLTAAVDQIVARSKNEIKATQRSYSREEPKSFFMRIFDYATSKLR